MRIALRVVFILLIVALGWWLYTVFFPSPETVIRKRLQSVAELASFSNKEGNIAMVANVSQLVGRFSTTVEVQVDSPARAQHTFSGKDEIQTALLAVRRELRGLDVQFLDPKIVVNADKTAAEVHLTAEARVTGDRDTFIQELKVGFEKVERDWLIARIETVRTLK